MSEFRPSSIRIDTMLASALGSAEQEVAAMCVTNYLTASNADWSAEFSWKSFVQWVNTSASSSLNGMYVQMLHMYGGNFVIEGVHGLVDRGYISRRDSDDATYFTVTPELAKAMERYAV